jgi:hypothetical protein
MAIPRDFESGSDSLRRQSPNAREGSQSDHGDGLNVA